MAKQNKLTAHHMIWTRRNFDGFELRHYRKAIIPLPRKLHQQLHDENEPFVPVSEATMEKMNRLLSHMQISTHSDVLSAMNRICGELLYDETVQGQDREALKQNIIIASRHKRWLDDHVARFNKR